MTKQKGLAVYLPADECKNCTQLKARVRDLEIIRDSYRHENQRLRLRKCSVFETAEHAGAPAYFGSLHMFLQDESGSVAVVENGDGKMCRVPVELVQMKEPVK